MLALGALFQGKEWSTIILDIESHSCEGDSGHSWLSMIPSAPTNQRWWEGSYILLATLTFHMYMSADCDTGEIGIDSMFWPPASHLTFTRHDAVVYYPRHFLPVKDTIYIVPCLDPNITCPDPETQHTNGNFTTTTQWQADDGNPLPEGAGIEITSVSVVGGLPPGITGASVNFVGPTPGPGQGVKSTFGTVTYTVGDHCQPGGPITLEVVNNCDPPRSDQCQFTVTLTNTPPVVTCPPAMTGPYDELMVSGPIVCFDADGDPTTTMITGVVPMPINMPVIVGDHVEWMPTCDDVCITYTVTIPDGYLRRIF
jgi:hypothetical protein